MQQTEEQVTQDMYIVNTHPNTDEKAKQVLKTYMSDLVDAGMTRPQIFDRAYAVGYGIISTYEQALGHAWEYDLKIAQLLREVADAIGISHRSRRRILEEQYARTTEVMESK